MFLHDEEISTGIYGWGGEEGEGEVCECVWAKTVRKDQVLPGAVCLLEEQLHPGLLEVPGSTGS